MSDCETLYCVYNLMPDLGMDDAFIIIYLVSGMALLIYLMIDAWKGE